MSSENDQMAETPHESGSNNPWDQSVPALTDLAALFADMAACVRFFSRLPLAPVNGKDNPAAVPDFRQIARAAPLAGAFVALPAAGVGLFAGYTTLPAMVIAILVAGCLAIVTGALHEDGLSDVADGFFGGTSPDKRLDIMKDSRIGAFGALALIFAILLKVALLTALWQTFGPAKACLAFLTSEALSRTMIVWQWRTLPLARPDGLAARYGKPDAKTLSQALVVSLVLLLPAVLTLPVSSLSLGGLVAAGAAYATGHLAMTKIGGATGDVLGAIQQLSGLGFLLGLLMVA